jgi:hypothetical protein
MDYKIKYLKYKLNCNLLKYKLNCNLLKYKLNCNLLKNNLYQFGGMMVKTKPNNGTKEGMSNQCFWISILDYLTQNRFNDLTLRDLREWAGLDHRTQHTMFDTDEEIFRLSIVKLLQFLRHIDINLKIKIYRVNYDGNIVSRANAFALNIAGTDLIDDRSAIFDDNSGEIVRIANFGLGHFELITNIDNDLPIEYYIRKSDVKPSSSNPPSFVPDGKPSSSNPPQHAMPSYSKPPPFAPHIISSSSRHSDDSYKFVPRVLIGDKYIPLSEIPEAKQGYFNQLNEYKLFTEILKDELNENEKEILRLIEEKNTISKSTDISEYDKDIFLNQTQREIEKGYKNIDLIKLNIRKYKEEILSMDTLIKSEDI